MDFFILYDENRRFFFSLDCIDCFLSMLLPMKDDVAATAAVCGRKNDIYEYLPTPARTKNHVWVIFCCLLIKNKCKTCFVEKTDDTHHMFQKAFLCVGKDLFFLFSKVGMESERDRENEWWNGFLRYLT